jgi:hypothetical protein
MERQVFIFLAILTVDFQLLVAHMMMSVDLLMGSYVGSVL